MNNDIIKILNIIDEDIEITIKDNKVNVVGKDLGEVNDKIESLMQLLNKMEGMITNNNKEIANFFKEKGFTSYFNTEDLSLHISW